MGEGYAPTTGAMLAGRVRPRRPRVLLAEDDEELRRLLAATLRRRGYPVIEAGDGREALRHVGMVIFERNPADRPEVIVADVQMPGLSGVDVLRAVRMAHLGTPVILATAFGDTVTRTEAEALGVSDLLDKPFRSRDLLHAVDRAARPLLSGWRRVA